MAAIPSTAHPVSPVAPRPPAAPVLRAGRRVHFLGIGGIGMSGLARALYARGVIVSGSDRDDGPVLERLARQGIPVAVGHTPEALGEAEAVIYTSALPADHPVWAEVRRRGLPAWHRAEVLGALTAQGRLLAVAGTHGKTTCSAALAHVLAACGRDPTALVGGEVIGWGRLPVRLGRPPWMVAEADESDGSFLHLQPEALLLTNVEPDHLDHHGTTERLERSFAGLVARLPAAGTLAYCRDDPVATRLAAAHPGRKVPYGLHPAAAVRPEVEEMAPGAMRLAIAAGGGREALTTSLGGRHNAVNLAGVFALATAAGLPAGAVARALEGFRGVARRQEYVGAAAGYRVFDDYAHHPTEVRATLEMFREVYRAPLTVVFQPHLYSRTEQFAGAFAAALRPAERVYVCEVYAAREAPRPGVSGRMIVEGLRGHPDAHFLPRWRDFSRVAGPARHPGELLLILGAGDVTGLGARMMEEGTP